MLSRVSKVLLKNVIRHTDTHNRLVEEDDMWRQRQGVSEKRKSRSYRSQKNEDYEIQGAHMDNSQDTKSYADRENLLEEKPNSTFWMQKLYSANEADPERWGHGGFKELYPDEFGTTWPTKHKRQHSVDSHREKTKQHKKLKKKHKEEKDREEKLRPALKSEHHMRKKKKKRGTTSRDRSHSRERNNGSHRARSRSLSASTSAKQHHCKCTSQSQTRHRSDRKRRKVSCSSSSDDDREHYSEVAESECECDCHNRSSGESHDRKSLKTKKKRKTKQRSRSRSPSSQKRLTNGNSAGHSRDRKRCKHKRNRQEDDAALLPSKHSHRRGSRLSRRDKTADNDVTSRKKHSRTKFKSENSHSESD